MITDYQKARWQSVSDNTPPAAVPVAGEEDEATELSLDPADWESFRLCAHAALDDAIEFVRTARQRPVWQSVPERVRIALSGSVPESGRRSGVSKIVS